MISSHMPFHTSSSLRLLLWLGMPLLQEALSFLTPSSCTADFFINVAPIILRNSLFCAHSSCAVNILSMIVAIYIYKPLTHNFSTPKHLSFVPRTAFTPLTVACVYLHDLNLPLAQAFPLPLPTCSPHSSLTSLCL